MQLAFGTYYLGIIEGVIIPGSALSVIPILEFGKFFVRKKITQRIIH